MKKKIKARVRSLAGETIAETLVALLISSLALLMLAGAVSSAVRIVLRSENKLEAYYKKDENVAAHNTKTGTISVTLKEDTDDLSEKIGPFSYTENYYLNDEFGRAAVISYSADK